MNIIAVVLGVMSGHAVLLSYQIIRTFYKYGKRLERDYLLYLIALLIISVSLLYLMISIAIASDRLI